MQKDGIDVDPEEYTVIWESDKSTIVSMESEDSGRAVAEAVGKATITAKIYTADEDGAMRIITATKEITVIALSDVDPGDNAINLPCYIELDEGGYEPITLVIPAEDIVRYEADEYNIYLYMTDLPTRPLAISDKNNTYKYAIDNNSSSTEPTDYHAVYFVYDGIEKVGRIRVNIEGGCYIASMEEPDPDNDILYSWTEDIDGISIVIDESNIGSFSDIDLQKWAIACGEGYTYEITCNNDSEATTAYELSDKNYIITIMNDDDNVKVAKNIYFSDIND